MSETVLLKPHGTLLQFVGFCSMLNVLQLLITRSYCVGGYIPKFTFIVHYVCSVNFQNCHSGMW